MVSDESNTGSNNGNGENGKSDKNDNSESDANTTNPEGDNNQGDKTKPSNNYMTLLRALAKALPICLEVHEGGLTQQTLAGLLQRLAAWPALPPLLMRTALLALRRHPRLRPWFLQAFLPALLRRRVHEVPALWAGFVRCCTRLGPDACPVLLQADRAALARLVAASPDVRHLLAEYAKRRSLPVDIQRLITDSEVPSHG